MYILLHVRHSCKDQEQYILILNLSINWSASRLFLPKLFLISRWLAFPLLLHFSGQGKGCAPNPRLLPSADMGGVH